MGWANCGYDSKGRSIGYIFEAICDYPECNEKIDRGLAYACGGMHGEHDYYCEKYFCSEHLRYGELPNDECTEYPICEECRKALEEALKAETEE
jgi:hypothetical protein